MTDGATTHNILVLLQTRHVDDWDTSTLIEWSSHENARVRDWATFALAVRDEDSEVIRLALLDRTGDSDVNCQSEALLGLARRRDSRGIAPLAEALAGETVGALIIEAAGFYARQDLAPLLEALKPWWDAEEALLEDSLLRCRGKATPGRAWEYLVANDST